MQETNQSQNYLQEDEIDLKELFQTIWKKRIFIIFFTAIVTIFAIVFALVKTPIYETRAIVELGSYKDAAGKTTLLDDAIKLNQELNILYIDILKNKEDRTSWIEKISVLNNQKNFLEIVSNGLDNTQAQDELNIVVKYIKQKHKKVIDEIFNKKKIELKDIERRIALLKTNNLKIIDENIEYLKHNTLVGIEENIHYDKKIKLPSIVEKTAALQKKLEDMKKQLHTLETNIIKTKKQDPTLTALSVMEKRNLESLISQLQLDIIDLKNSKESLETITIPKLLRDKDELLNIKLVRLLRDRDKLINITLEQIIEEKTTLEQSLLPHNYKNSAIVGKIITNDYPIKPKKKLIVVVAFVTGFILSIFIVFFMQFISGFKEEKEIETKA